MSTSPYDATTPAQAETFASPVTTSAETKAETSSLGEIIADIGQDLSTLLRQEVELAKAEARESAKKAGRGAGMFGGAATAGWFALLFLSIAVWEWLSSALDSRGWAAVIVMVAWAIIAAVLAATGRSAFRNIDGLQRTVDTSKRIPDALKGHEETR
jgi:hypothetical protein